MMQTQKSHFGQMAVSPLILAGGIKAEQLGHAQ
jgi:hypothetical protein